MPKVAREAKRRPSRSSATIRLRAIFFGSSSFAVPALEALAAGHDIVAVVTQPERPAGRGLELRPTPAMEAARALRLTTFAPDRLDQRFQNSVEALRPQLLACASYGKILPASLLGVGSLGALNVHPSLLPEYRGATPIQAALREGRTRTGVTVFWMTREMDAGDIALAREVEIEPADDYGRLHDRLAAVGADLLVEAADALANGELPRTAQDHARATYTKPIHKEDLRISESATAKQIVDLVRSASPSPAAWTVIEGKRVKVLEACAEPSEPADTTKAWPVIAAADGRVRLVRVVPEGKREMSGAEFAASLARRKE